jgi:hypothetical protein
VWSIDEAIVTGENRNAENLSQYKIINYPFMTTGASAKFQA